MTPLVLELGGKSANLVFDDADLDRVVMAAVRGVTRLNGQVCVAPTRLVVQRAVYQQIAERVVAGLAEIKVGDPSDPDTVMGPVISHRARERIMSMVEAARGSGAGQLITGGQPVDHEGFYVAPTVFSDVDKTSPIAQTEVFGPVLCMMPFDDEEEAVQIANDTPYGLAGYVHTADVARALSISSRLEVGTVSVNGGTVVSAYGPFGGFRDSGYGKEGGWLGIQEFLRTKRVSISLH